jgi:hypothetical protein
VVAWVATNRENSRVRRVLLLALVLPVAASAVTAAAAIVPPRCTSADAAKRTLVSRDGYELACRPGAAIVWVDGIRTYINRSKCFNASRLYFGRAHWSNPNLPPTNNLYLVVDPPRKAGKVRVIDGVLEIVLPSGRVLAGTISGRANVASNVRQGSFVIDGSTGTARGHRFTGKWTCG